MKKVLIAPKSFRGAGEKPFQILRKRGFEIIENKTGKTFDEDQMIEMCSDVDGLIVGVDPVTCNVLEKAARLKAISKYGAGLDNIDLDAAGKKRIKVMRAAGANSVSVAELAISMVFALARNIVPMSRETRNGGWNRKCGIEVTGKTIGIMGMGSIGRESALMAHGLGMDIIAYDPFINKDDEFIQKYNIIIVDSEDLFRNADFVSLHMPLTEDTKYMIGNEVLNFMKPTAYLINTARGELVDEDALYDALCSGVIAGAASDVFSKEPPGRHPLTELDNFILTPHIGAYTVEANQKMAGISVKNLLEMLERGWL